VAFEPLRCRLVHLTTTVDAAPELAAMRAKLDKHLGKARGLLDKADARCRLAKKGPAKKSLRMTKKRLAMLGKVLHAKPSRSVPAGVTEPIMRSASSLGADVLRLSSTLVCR
jgi:hypothetical protein